MAENVLRRYGVTSAGLEYSHRRHGQEIVSDSVNIQRTVNSQTLELVDFGAFLAGFDVFNFDSRYSVYNGQRPQPDHSRSLPQKEWGPYFDRTWDPKLDRPWVYSHQLADAYSNGLADRSAFESHLRNFLEPIEAKLGRRASCRAL